MDGERCRVGKVGGEMWRGSSHWAVEGKSVVGRGGWLWVGFVWRGCGGGCRVIRGLSEAYTKV